MWLGWCVTWTCGGLHSLRAPNRRPTHAKAPSTNVTGATPQSWFVGHSPRDCCCDRYRQEMVGIASKENTLVAKCSLPHSKGPDIADHIVSRLQPGLHAERQSQEAKESRSLRRELPTDSEPASLVAFEAGWPSQLLIDMSIRQRRPSSPKIRNDFGSKVEPHLNAVQTRTPAIAFVGDMSIANLCEERLHTRSRCKS